MTAIIPGASRPAPPRLPGRWAIVDSHPRASAPAAPAPSEEYQMSFREYASYDGLGLAELVAKGEVKASELVEEAIARIEKHNPSINAVIHKT